MSEIIDYIKIPVWLAACYDLTWQEKFIYAEIMYRDNLKDGCTAKQKTIGSKYNIKSDVCSRIFKSLEKKGFISKSDGCIHPLKSVDNLSIKVDQKSIKDTDKKLTKSQLKVDQKSNEVDQKSSPHSIYKNKLKTNSENKEEKPAHENINSEIPLNEKPVEEKKKKQAQKKENAFGKMNPPAPAIYAIFHKYDSNMFTERFDAGLRKDCEGIYYQVRDMIVRIIEDEKKILGYSPTHDEIIKEFDLACYHMSDYVKQNVFRPDYVNRKFSSFYLESKSNRNKAKPVNGKTRKPRTSRNSFAHLYDDKGNVIKQK